MRFKLKTTNFHEEERKNKTKEVFNFRGGFRYNNQQKNFTLLINKQKSIFLFALNEKFQYEYREKNKKEVEKQIYKVNKLKEKENFCSFDFDFQFKNEEEEGKMEFPVNYLREFDEISFYSFFKDSKIDLKTKESLLLLPSFAIIYLYFLFILFYFYYLFNYNIHIILFNKLFNYIFLNY